MPASPAAPLAAAKAVFWHYKHLVEQFSAGYLRNDVAMIIALLGCLALVAIAVHALWRGVRRRTFSDWPTRALLIALAFGFLTITTHVFFAVHSAAWFVWEQRYFTVVLPALVFGFACNTLQGNSGRDARAAPAFEPSRPGQASAVGPVLLLGACALLFGLQLQHYWGEWRKRGQGDRYEVLAASLSSLNPSFQTIVRSLAADSRAHDPVILTVDPHQLYVLTGLPSVGLTGSSYTSTVWTEARVIDLLARLRIDAIFVPDNHASYADQPYFADLAKGYIPSYLEPLSRGIGTLYRVDRSRLDAGAGD